MKSGDARVALIGFPSVGKVINTFYFFIIVSISETILTIQFVIFVNLYIK